MNIETIIAAVVAVFASTGFWQFVQYKAQATDRAKDALTQGVLSLLHNRIYELAREAIKRGGITEDELDELENLYRPYKALGGNGTGCQLYERAKKLPLISDTEVE